MTREQALINLKLCKSLDDLLIFLTSEYATALSDNDWCELPTFGGIAPRNTSGIWSWDNNRVLSGQCASDLQIEDRIEP